jgi:hypothetical protein
MPSMLNFSRKYDVAVSIIHQGKASRFASWIKFEAQGFRLWLFHYAFEHNGEGIFSVYGGFALREQEPRPCWVDWI